MLRRSNDVLLEESPRVELEQLGLLHQISAASLMKLGNFTAAEMHIEAAIECKRGMSNIGLCEVLAFDCPGSVA